MTWLTEGFSENVVVSERGMLKQIGPKLIYVQEDRREEEKQKFDEIEVESEASAPKPPSMD